MALFPFAIVAFIVYTLAFPAWVFWSLWKNKRTIKKAQLLTAMGKKINRKADKAGFEFTRRWSKLFYQFKPGKWYWVMVIIGRKFAISTSAMLFRSVPAFQFACALMALFVAFAVQVCENATRVCRCSCGWVGRCCKWNNIRTVCTTDESHDCLGSTYSRG